MSEKDSRKSTKKGSKAKTKSKSYKERYEELLKRAEDMRSKESGYVDSLKRLKAEFENYKKRTEKERSLVVEMASEEVIEKLLPVIDNLERALKSVEQNGNSEAIGEGLKLVHNQLKEILAKEGLEKLCPEGQPFDPNLHEAVLQVESDSHQDETVLEVLQDGYLLKGKVLRPAMVKVAKVQSV